MATSGRRPAGWRVVVFAVIVLLLIGLSSWAVRDAVTSQQRNQKPTAASKADTALDMGAVLLKPHILFRSTSPGPTFGQLAAVPLADPGGVRSVSGLVCDRLYATRVNGICLKAEGSGIIRYRQTILGPRLTPVGQSPLGGLPSRARISPDGSLMATTVFVTGHGYATLGFSTETVIRNVDSGEDYGNLEKTFAVKIDPRRDRASDLNIWGVTFAPRSTSTFYATAAAGGGTWLMRGDLAARTLTAIRPDVECPSISPNGRYIAYKKRAGSPVNWRLHVLDLSTGKDHALPETRSIDDQVEWLDDSHVLYGVARAVSGDSDVWISPLSSGRPRIFMPHAASPVVVH